MQIYVHTLTHTVDNLLVTSPHGGMRKLENLEYTHLDMGRVCTNQAQNTGAME